MLIWQQKNTAGAVTAPAANSPDMLLGGQQANLHRSPPANDAAFSSSLDAKTFATMIAQFALAGCEMHVIRKAKRQHFEIRRLDQCYACSTLHGLASLLAQMGGAK